MIVFVGTLPIPPFQLIIIVPKTPVVLAPLKPYVNVIRKALPRPYSAQPPLQTIQLVYVTPLVLTTYPAALN